MLQEHGLGRMGRGEEKRRHERRKEMKREERTAGEKKNEVGVGIHGRAGSLSFSLPLTRALAIRK